MILIVKHIDIEGPGTLGDFLSQRGEAFRIVELGAGESLPEDPRAFKAIVVLGGPMNVDEEHIYPFLKPEIAFIQKTLAAKVPFLGICLGSQLLAKAAGAKVIPSPVKEIGWYHIQLTPDGEKDPLFKGFKNTDPVYHWHGDMFQIPHGAHLLATATGCPHQALRVGDCAYGVQFHVEVTDVSIKEWCKEYIERDLIGRREHADLMIKQYYDKKEMFHQTAYRFYENFLSLIQV